MIFAKVPVWRAVRGASHGESELPESAGDPGWPRALGPVLLLWQSASGDGGGVYVFR